MNSKISFNNMENREKKWLLLLSQLQVFVGLVFVIIYCFISNRDEFEGLILLPIVALVLISTGIFNMSVLKTFYQSLLLSLSMWPLLLALMCISDYNSIQRSDDSPDEGFGLLPFGSMFVCAGIINVVVLVTLFFVNRNKHKDVSNEKNFNRSKNSAQLFLCLWPLLIGIPTMPIGIGFLFMFVAIGNVAIVLGLSFKEKVPGHFFQLMKLEKRCQVTSKKAP